MQRYSWIPVALVAALSFGAFAYTALTLPEPEPPETSVVTWQTYCAVTYPNDGMKSAAEVKVERIGSPTDTTRFGTMFLQGEELRVWDMSDKRQFILSGDRSFQEVPPVSCPPFGAYDYEFTWRDGFIDACRREDCTSVAVKPSTMPFAFAAARGGVLVGTSHGDTLLFRNDQWCRMHKVGTTWSCPRGDLLPIVTEPSNQLYSSITVGSGGALVGEFPTGALYRFDGKVLSRWNIAPPPDRSFASESQTMAYYCGELYVGYWPKGEVWRLTKEGWDGPINLFSTPPQPEFPFMDEAEENDLVINFFGRRVPSLIVKDGSLYAMTSSKTLWPSDLGNPIGDAADEYGVLWRIRKEGCAPQT